MHSLSIHFLSRGSDQTPIIISSIIRLLSSDPEFYFGQSHVNKPRKIFLYMKKYCILQIETFFATGFLEILQIASYSRR